jgi:hypothetical protein
MGNGLRTFVASVLALGLLSFAVGDVGAGAKDALAGYQRTGELKDCIPTSRIAAVRIIGKRQILFDMLGGDDYLNEPAHCVALEKTDALVYERWVEPLCTPQAIEVRTPGSAVPSRGPCYLAKFERLERVE